MKASKKKYLSELKTRLQENGVRVELDEGKLRVWKGSQSLVFFVAGEDFDFHKHKSHNLIPFDYLVTRLPKIVAMILTRLQLNRTVFARNCTVKKISREEANVFLDKYHLMNSAQSAWNLGLYHKDELIAVASFSKGRKMNRLKENERSYELIRFCSKEGYSIAGGLSKLVKTFCREKKAGDVMTYVDRQLSDGSSFLRAGFKKHSETAPAFFLVDRRTYHRKPLKSEKDSYDKSQYYLTQNSGNIKLIYTPHE